MNVKDTNTRKVRKPRRTPNTDEHLSVRWLLILGGGAAAGLAAAAGSGPGPGILAGVALSGLLHKILR